MTETEIESMVFKLIYHVNILNEVVKNHSEILELLIEKNKDSISIPKLRKETQLFEI